MAVPMFECAHDDNGDCFLEYSADADVDVGADAGTGTVVADFDTNSD